MGLLLMVKALVVPITLTLLPRDCNIWNINLFVMYYKLAFKYTYVMSLMIAYIIR